MGADFWGSLGLGLESGADMATSLMPAYFQGKANASAAEIANAKKLKLDEQRKNLQNEWLKEPEGNDKKAAYMKATGATDAQADETVTYENPDQMKGAAMLMDKIAKDQEVNQAESQTDIAGGAIPQEEFSVESLYGEDSPPLEGESYNELDIPEPGREVDPMGQSQDFSTGQSMEPTGGLPVEQSVEPPPSQGAEGGDLKSRWMKAIVAQESGGHGYDSPRGPKTRHGKALGKYQIIPKFWFDKIGLDSNKESDKKKFEKSPELQDKLASFVYADAWKKSKGDPTKASLVYYSGRPDPSNIDTIPQKGMPTPRQYAASVVGKMGDISNVQADTKPPTTAPESPMAPTAAPISTVPGQPGQPSFTSGPAGSMLKKHALKEPPKPVDIQNEYLDKLDKIYNSEAYINADPQVRKEFLDQVAEPYRKLANISKETTGMELNDFNKRTAEWGRNMRSMMNGEIREASAKSTQAGRVKSGQLLSKVQTKIRSLSQFRNNWAKAKGQKKADLLTAFSEYATTQDKEGFFAGVADFFGYDPKEDSLIGGAAKKAGYETQETVLDQGKIDKMINILQTQEQALMNQMNGSGTQVFEGLSEDIPTESSFAAEDDNLSKFISYDDEE